MAAASRVAGSEQVALAGACSGGIIAAMAAAHLAHAGRPDQIAALTLLVTVLDQARAGLASAVIDERTARLAAAASRARGYLDGRSLAAPGADLPRVLVAGLRGLAGRAVRGKRKPRPASWGAAG
ncbi:MAG: hypothetical protein ACRDOA_10560 [Streptosporangiaceae bacterium]